jgi:hypothetical protein
MSDACLATKLTLAVACARPRSRGADRPDQVATLTIGAIVGESLPLGLGSYVTITVR